MGRVLRLPPTLVPRTPHRPILVLPIRVHLRVRPARCLEPLARLLHVRVPGSPDILARDSAAVVARAAGVLGEARPGAVGA
jgi:hypothetical protein